MVNNPNIIEQKSGFLKKLYLAKTVFDYTDENKDSKLKVGDLLSLITLIHLGRATDCDK